MNVYIIPANANHMDEQAQKDWRETLETNGAEIQYWVEWGISITKVTPALLTILVSDLEFQELKAVNP